MRSQAERLAKGAKRTRSGEPTASRPWVPHRKRLSCAEVFSCKKAKNNLHSFLLQKMELAVQQRQQEMAEEAASEAGQGDEGRRSAG